MPRILVSMRLDLHPNVLVDVGLEIAVRSQEERANAAGSDNNLKLGLSMIGKHGPLLVGLGSLGVRIRLLSRRLLASSPGVHTDTVCILAIVSVKCAAKR